MFNFSNAITKAFNKDVREHFIYRHVELMNERDRMRVAYWLLSSTRIGLEEEAVRRVSDSKINKLIFVNAFPLPWYRWLRIYADILITEQVNGLYVSPKMMKRISEDRSILES